MLDQDRNDSSAIDRPRAVSWTPALRGPTGDVRILLAGVGEAVERLCADLQVRRHVARAIRLDLLLVDRTSRRERTFVDPWTGEESLLFRIARRLLARAVDPEIWVARIEVRFETARLDTYSAPLFKRELELVHDPRIARPSREQRLRIARFRDQFSESASSLVTLRR